MYTRCPECHTPYRVNVRRLQAGEEAVFCERCECAFNAGATLELTVPEAESPEGVAAAKHLPVAANRQATPIVAALTRPWMEEVEETATEESHRDRTMATEIRRRRGRSRSRPRPVRGDSWLRALGVIALAVLLAGQIFLFESKCLAQNAYVRPWLDSVCANLGCALPPFRDTANIRILNRNLNWAGNKKASFEFSLSFANQSPLPQAYPKLKLVLNQLGGNPIAERVFDPMEYFPDWQEDALMLVGTPVEVRLSIAKPSREIGGFGIEFQ